MGLWSIGTEWQAFACGVAEIGFHLAGDGIAPGLISAILLNNGFNEERLFHLLLMGLIAVSTLIFILSWKFVDYEIWDITKNNDHFDLMFGEQTPSTSTTIT